MIRFHCKNCGQKFSVPQTNTGKKGRCPKCKNIVVVPKVEDTKSVANQTRPGASEIGSKDSILDSRLFDVSQEGKVAGHPTAQESVSDKALDDLQKLKSGKVEPEPAPERKLPWIIDIFLYPANFHGMIFLTIAVLVPMVLQAAALLLCIFGFLFFLFNALIGMYIYWFLAQCVRDSAAGGLRAPETMVVTPGIWELLWQVFELFACFAVCAASAAVYLGYTRRFDTVFWLLAGGGAFLYPMALLTVIMFDSISGLNPLIIVPSIFSTFFQYCGLVVLIVIIIFLYVLTVNFLPSNPYTRMLLSPLVQAVELYLAMVAAHLLGRFYFKYQEKLNWEV
jgi:DNA-directed RNA polymerase subunit RPC12/RpoP